MTLPALVFVVGAGVAEGPLDCHWMPAAKFYPLSFAGWRARYSVSAWESTAIYVCRYSMEPRVYVERMREGCACRACAEGSEGQFGKWARRFWSCNHLLWYDH
jgi:hypothetical protein